MKKYKIFIGLLCIFAGGFAADAAQTGPGANDRISCEFATGGVDYQLVDFTDTSGELTDVYGNGKLVFMTQSVDAGKMWRDCEYAAFRSKPYDSGWLGGYLRDLRKKSIHRALHPPRERTFGERMSGTPILPGMLLAPVLLPITLPFEYAHDAREDAFAAAWKKLAIGTGSKQVVEMLGKPQSVSTNAASGYEVWGFRDNRFAGFANGKLVWKNASYLARDYGTGTHTGRW